MVDKEPRIRPLTREEADTFSSAVVQATLYVRSFRDAIALLRPFYDASAETAYTDRFARVGLGPWFFTITKYQQASVILHETMHVLNNHFVRFEMLGGHPKTLNFAGDFEINCGLDMHPKVDLSMGVFPDKDPYNYARHKSMEQYYHLLKTDINEGKFDQPDPNCPQHGKNSKKDQSGDSSDGQQSGGQQDSAGQGDSSGSEAGSDASQGSSSESGGQGSSGQGSGGSGSSGGQSGQDQSGSGSGQGGNTSGDHCTCEKGEPEPNGVSCDEPTEERSAEADEAGIDRASDAEQTIAKKNTAARIVEEIKHNKSRGDGHLNDFLEFAQKQLSPPKVPWQNIFRRVLSRTNDAIMRGRADYSYRRVNRRSHGSEFIFPGMVQYLPTSMLGIDTSGSMDATDFRKALGEAEGIMKAVNKTKDSLKVFSIDTKIGDVRPVSSVKNIALQGGGGTEMSPAWKYVTSLSKKNRPDVFVLVTDGGVAWEPVVEQLRKSEKLYKSIILITQANAMPSVPSEMKRLATVIDIS